MGHRRGHRQLPQRRGEPVRLRCQACVQRGSTALSAAFATDPATVADQAAVVAAAWAPPGAPASWGLIAAQLQTLAEDRELCEIAARIEPGRLPPLLFTAAATHLVLELGDGRLRESFPRVGGGQPPLDGAFAGRYREFCLEHREALLELCGRHRYQMNEVGRCADVLVALGPTIAEGREIALVDIGTGAGLALHLDRYRYVFDAPQGASRLGEPSSDVVIATELRGSSRPPVPAALPRIVDRIGIDIEPVDLAQPGVRDWLAACIPQEASAVARFHHAVEVALSHPCRLIRGEALSVLPEVLASIPERTLVCLVDTYVHVFFDADQLTRFRAFVDEVGATRDLDWISVDPLVPMGVGATDSVSGLAVPQTLIDRNHAGAVFGVISRVSYRSGRRSSALLGVAHPGAAWLEWLDPSSGVGL